MDVGKSKNPGWFSGIVKALLISLTIHVLLFAFGFLILNRRIASDRELPMALAVQLSAQQEVLLSVPEQESQGINETGQTDFSVEPSTSIDEIRDNLSVDTSTSTDEIHSNKPLSNDAADFTESFLQPWEIDVPPTLSVPGTIGVEKDFTPLLDALPLIASIYLNELGLPFLIIYDPIPNNEALRRLNTFFTSSTFSPALVQNRPVPSVLNLPLSVKGLTP